MGKEDRDAWIVKCPKCGKVDVSCRHVSAEDVRRILRLLKAGIEVFPAEDDEPEVPELHVHEPVHLAHVVKPRFAWSDLVLATTTREGLEDALTELRHKTLMYKGWGLRRVVKKTKGISLLFAGPPGTGKTMAAEALAHELGRPLHIVNYAQMENMWVGETEKNIERVFATASEEGAVLFFDEADAVFFRRGFMTAPWMNRDVNVLLSHIENFAGVVVLATNLPRTLDRALDRRIDIAVEFPIPDAAMRLELYRRCVPKKAPLAKDVRFDLLAQRYPLSGGSILNVVRGAMRSALKRGQRHRITQADFVRAAERESRKATLLAQDHLQPSLRQEKIRGYA